MNPAIRNYTIGKGETFSQQLTYSINGVVQDLSDYDITWAGKSLVTGELLWWETPLSTPTMFSLAKNMDFEVQEIAYDVRVVKKSTQVARTVLMGIIKIEERVTPTGTPS